MAKHAKRPRSARSRTLPPDAASLEQMLRAVHRELVARATHCKIEPHDTHARRGFQTLFEQRADAWRDLFALAPERALAFAGEFNLRLPADAVTSVGVRP